MVKLMITETTKYIHASSQNCDVSHKSYLQTVRYLGRAVVVYTHSITTTLLHSIIRRIQLYFTKTTSTNTPSHDIAVNAPAAGPLWNNYTYRPRKVKQQIRSVPTTTVAAKVLQQAKAAHGQTVHLGAGIQNSGNSCYIAASLQALRFLPTFRTSLTRQLKQTPIAQELNRLFSIIEGKKGHKKREVTREEIAHFRRLCMKHGWRPRHEYSQEDPREFLGFLLNILAFPTFRYKIQKKHDFVLPIRIPNLEPTAPLIDTYIELNIHDSKDGASLRQVAGNNLVIEEIDKAAIPIPENASTDVLRLLDTLDPITPLTTHQSIAFVDIPRILPFSLVRDVRTRGAACTEKSTKSVMPSLELEQPLVHDPSQVARYRLKSLIVIEGQSADCGHCRTFVPIQNKNNTLFFEFNDSKTLLHSDTSKIESIIEHYGCYYFYELVGVS